MEPVTILCIIALAMFFVLAVFTHKFEFSILSLIMGFGTFIAITQDTTISQDIVMVLYVPLIAIILFTFVQIWRAKI